MTVLNWKQLASIEVGGAICLPVIMVGHKLCAAYGWPSAILGILLGNALLLLMACATVFMSAEHRLSTPENAKKYFGENGAKLFALLLLMAKTCWFALQLNMMVLSIQEIFQISAMLPITIGLGICILAVAMHGLKALSALSSISMPILVITMAAAMYLADQRGEAMDFDRLSFGSISIAIGAAITAVIDMPTYFRHVKSTKDGLTAVLILFAVAIPIIEGVGVYLAYHNPAETVVATLMKPNTFLWNLWILFFMLLAGWTTNNTNLYSAAVCLGAICKNIKEKACLAIIAICGTCLALAQVLDHFGLFLQMLGIFVGSMGAVILTNYISQATPKIAVSLSAWGLGVAFGLMNLFQMLSLTPIAVLDAYLIATLLTLLGRGYEAFNYRTAR